MSWSTVWSSARETAVTEVNWVHLSSFERFHAPSPRCSLGLCSPVREFLVFLHTDSARTIISNRDCISHLRMRGSFCCLVLWLVASQLMSISMERSVEHLAFRQSTCEIGWDQPFDSETQEGVWQLTHIDTYCELKIGTTRGRWRESCICWYLLHLWRVTWRRFSTVRQHPCCGEGP